jgi:hypothetical protein
MFRKVWNHEKAIFLLVCILRSHLGTEPTFKRNKQRNRENANNEEKHGKMMRKKRHLAFVFIAHFALALPLTRGILWQVGLAFFGAGDRLFLFP